MSLKDQNPGAFTPKKLRRSIKLDRVQAADFNHLPLVYACEQCSFYAQESNTCMMGMPTAPHLRDQQLKTFHLMGHMAFCRFLEID